MRYKKNDLGQYVFPEETIAGTHAKEIRTNNPLEAARIRKARNTLRRRKNPLGSNFTMFNKRFI